MLVSILLTILLSLFSTAILSYISMAVMIGPWIDPTIVLFAMLLSALFVRKKTTQEASSSLALITSGASLGGILATGCGFSFPTLYFLDPHLFATWLQSPLYFIAFMAALAFTAGAFGILVAEYCEKELLITQKMEFSVGQMLHGMIFAQDQARKMIELLGGFCLALVYGISQKCSSLIPSTFVLFQSYATRFFIVPAIKLPMVELPMLWAIGFVTGHVIAIPLLIGILSQIFVMSPLKLYLFSHLDSQSFSLAFGTGMILYGTLLSFIGLPKMLFFALKNTLLCENSSFEKLSTGDYTPALLAQWAVGLACIMGFLTYCQFSYLSQAYLIAGTLIATYQLLVIGGKTGIAPLGRFATFVLVPGMLLFSFNSVQIMVVSTFIEIAGGVGVDVLFGRKMALMAGIDRKKVAFFQWLGLVVSALSVGVMFWLLINQLGLGTEQLLAQKALNRALLLQVKSFDFFALVVGALYGAVLKDLKINPMLVLGGILMPIDYSLVLVLGGLSTYLVKNKEEQYPFWSGVFAANSAWMIIKALL